MSVTEETIHAEIGLAWRHLREGELDLAVNEFQRILEADAHNIDAYYGLGLAQRTVGDMAAAQQSFERALHLLEGTDFGSSDALEHHDNPMMLARMIRQRLAEINPQSYQATEAAEAAQKLRTPSRTAPVYKPSEERIKLFTMAQTSETTVSKRRTSTLLPNEWVALIAGIIPFFFYATQTTTTSDPEGTTSTYTNYAALVFGAIAVLATLSGLPGLSRLADEDRNRRYLVFAALLLLGVVQVLRGLGIIRL